MWHIVLWLKSILLVGFSSGNRWCWNQSMFHQLSAENPCICDCKLFTNIRGFVHIVWVLTDLYNQGVDILLDCNCLHCAYWQMFFAWGCVPGAIFPNILPREQGENWIIWSLEIMSFDIIPVASEYQHIQIPTMRWILSVSKSILPW